MAVNANEVILADFAKSVCLDFLATLTVDVSSKCAKYLILPEISSPASKYLIYRLIGTRKGNTSLL